VVPAIRLHICSKPSKFHRILIQLVFTFMVNFKIFRKIHGKWIPFHSISVHGRVLFEKCKMQLETVKYNQKIILFSTLIWKYIHKYITYIHIYYAHSLQYIQPFLRWEKRAKCTKCVRKIYVFSFILDTWAVKHVTSFLFFISKFFISAFTVALEISCICYNFQ
jgi:hypothetical protein